MYKFNLVEYINELDSIGMEYDVSFILSDLQGLDDNLFYNSYMSDKLYNKLYNGYSVEMENEIPTDISFIKHIKSLPECFGKLGIQDFRVNTETLNDMGIEFYDIEILFTKNTIEAYYNEYKGEIL